MPSTTVSPIIILVIIIVLLCTGTLVQHYAILPPLNTAVTEQKRFSFDPVIPYTNQLDLMPSTSSSLPPTPKSTIPEACKQVDFHWL